MWGVDEYVQGDVLRISPEAPVPVVEVKTVDKKLGLSANVAANIRSLGGEPLLFSLVGPDSNGENLRKQLKEQGISDRYLMMDPRRSTTTKLRVMSSHQHIVRVDFENRSPVNRELLFEHWDSLSHMVGQCDCVVIQDYGKGLVDKESCQRLIQLAKAKGRPVIVDPHRRTPLGFYEGALFMTPNREEAFELAKQIPKPEIWEDLDAIGREFMEVLKSPQMVITLGDQGIRFFSQEGVSELPTFAREVFDVTGAGDYGDCCFCLGFIGRLEFETGGLVGQWCRRGCGQSGGGCGLFSGIPQKVS